MWTKTAFFGFPHCAHRSEEESETGGWDGHPAGVYFIHLPASPPPHPSSPFCLQHNLQAPVSPFGIVLPLLGPSFPPPTPLHHIHFPFILYCELSGDPSLPLLCFFGWTNWQWRRRSVWRRDLPIPATCLGCFAHARILSHDAKETRMIYMQSISPFSACSLCRATVWWWAFVIVMKLPRAFYFSLCQQAIKSIYSTSKQYLD